jgi:hypothetical protein
MRAESPDLDLLAAAALGSGLDEEAEAELWRAPLCYADDDVAEAHLRRAEALAPGHLAVGIGFYRFYFYKGRLGEALVVAERCLTLAARALGREDWRAVAPGDAAFGAFDAVLARFFLFTLKGYAYLQMRLGRAAAGGEAVAHLLALDPTDKVGAKVLRDVAEREGIDDDV